MCVCVSDASMCIYVCVCDFVTLQARFPLWLRRLATYVSVLVFDVCCCVVLCVDGYWCVLVYCWMLMYVVIDTCDV